MCTPALEEDPEKQRRRIRVSSIASRSTGILSRTVARPWATCHVGVCLKKTPAYQRSHTASCSSMFNAIVAVSLGPSAYAHLRWMLC